MRRRKSAPIPMASFPEETPEAPRRRRASMSRRRTSSAAALVTPPPAPPPPPSTSLSPSTSLNRKTSHRPIVLHGRVVKEQDDRVVDTSSISSSNLSRVDLSPALGARPSTDEALSQQHLPRRPRSFVRENMERRRALSNLTNETTNFQKQVTDLEAVLNAVDASSSSDAWRAKNKIKAVLETDKTLWESLFEYEKRLTLSDDGGGVRTEYTDDLRSAQTECMKLHRDFKRSHKALVMALSLYETRQHNDASQIGGVGWTGGGTGQDEKLEEVVDTRFELTPISPPPPPVRRTVMEPPTPVEESSSNGVAAEEEVYIPIEEEKEPGCFGGYVCGAVNCAQGWMTEDDEFDDLSTAADETTDEDDASQQKQPRKFNFPRYMESLKQELLVVGKVLLVQGKRLDCGGSGSSSTVESTVGSTAGPTTQRKVGSTMRPATFTC